MDEIEEEIKKVRRLIANTVYGATITPDKIEEFTKQLNAMISTNDIIDATTYAISDSLNTQQFIPTAINTYEATSVDDDIPTWTGHAYSVEDFIKICKEENKPKEVMKWEGL